MSQLLLINPRKRRTPKRGTGGRFVKAKRASNPAPRKRRSKRRANPIVNVTRRTRKATRKAPRRSRARRSNPIAGLSGITGTMSAIFMPSVTGAAGALGLDILMGFAPIPMAMKVGGMRYITKGVGAVALGLLAGMVVNKSTANKMAVGALTVTLHDFAREQTRRLFPNMPMGEVGEYVDGLGYYSPGLNAGMLTDESGGGMGEFGQMSYDAAEMDGVGFYVDGATDADVSGDYMDYETS